MGDHQKLETDKFPFRGREIDLDGPCHIAADSRYLPSLEKLAMDHGRGHSDGNERACWNVFLKINGAAISPFFYAGSFALVCYVMPNF